jgi:O-succinylbenzoic acid--CoA ligase
LKIFLNDIVFAPGESPNSSGHPEAESYVIQFIAKWMAGESDFVFRTSGSTGTPKSIVLTRNQLIASAKNTLTYLFGNEPIRRALLCVPPDRIGGAMQIVRALVASADLYVVAASAQALFSLPEMTFDLASVVPLQLAPGQIDFKKLRTILIGGTSLNPALEGTLSNIESTRFYHTYGMTETCSHVALRKLGEGHFQPLPGNEFSLDSRGCLKIRGDVTGGQCGLGHQFRWYQGLT